MRTGPPRSQESYPIRGYDRNLRPLALRDFAGAFVLWLAYDRRPLICTEPILSQEWMTLETFR
jgi:hypothetical protein